MFAGDILLVHVDPCACCHLLLQDSAIDEEEEEGDMYATCGPSPGVSYRHARDVQHTLAVIDTHVTTYSTH